MTTFKPLGPYFFLDLRAAGLHNGIAWGADSDSITITGWSDDDPRRATLAAVIAAHDPTKPAPIDPSSIVLTAPQFFIALGQSGYITTAEALAAARDGTVPAAIDKVFQALPPAQALAARITWARMTEVPRSNPLVQAAASAIGVTQAQIDALFLAAREI